METMMILYKSLIASYLDYGLILWGNESHMVLTLQKKAIRLISNSSYISDTNPLFIQHKLLKIGDLFKLKLLKLYYKLSYNLLLCYFDKYREIIEHEPARILRKNYIHPPLIIIYLSITMNSIAGRGEGGVGLVFIFIRYCSTRQDQSYSSVGK